MANNITDLGKVGITLKGEWSSDTTYERLDVVTYEGSSYVSKVDNNTGFNPTTSSAKWQLIAQHGEFTEQQLEDFKAEVVAESKEEIDDYTDAKETELDTYTTTKKAELDTYEDAKESELNGLSEQLTSAFNSNATSKTNTFNSNATSKTTDFNTNASNKTDAFDTNASAKTTAFNTNATNKTTAFDTNATSKTSDFNDNATAKTTAFDNNATSKTSDFNTNVTSKTAEFDTHVTEKEAEFDENVDEIQEEITDIQELIETELDESITEESTAIDVNDSAKWYGKLKVIGNAEQAQYEGNQLIDFSNYAKISTNGEYTFVNNILSFGNESGTFSHVEFDITGLAKSNSDKVLKFTFEDMNLDNQYGTPIQLIIKYNDGTSTLYKALVNHDKISYSYTIPSSTNNIENVTLCIYSNNSNISQASSVIITKPMMQFGTENKNYEPYVGRSSKSKSKFSTRH